MMVVRMEDIQKYMIHLKETYNASSNEQWDCIVISAADQEQKACFEMQLNAKIIKGDIPSQINYLVIADPPGVALGAGGSTFFILKNLESLYKEELYCKKIWIVHAGGSSKRLPNLSCTGKLFCPLPLDSSDGKTLCVLNVKLIIISPFLKMMRDGGIFVTACDDIETYSLEGLDELNPKLKPDGVVALAHPSSLKIGTKHGVYVLPPRPDSDNQENNCWLSSCLEVLQKPSISTMELKGALLNSGNQRVYTDSMFCCGPDLVRKMVAFAHDCADLYTTETCIYGDFLACMGTAEEKLYFQEISSSSVVKQSIANTFSRTPLDILVLEQSRFHHLGTMPEYLDNLQATAELFQTLGMKQLVGSDCRNSSLIQGIVINSLVEADIEMKPNSIMDNCIITVPLVCKESTILSHCRIESPIITFIPTGWLFHTAAIKFGNEIVHVTIAFHVTEDLKGNIIQSPYWKGINDQKLSCSIWQSKLFEARQTMAESFLATWKQVTNPPSVTSSSCRYSMQDIIKSKHLPSMMNHRAFLEGCGAPRLF